jgi:hypothetical protein
MPGWKTSKKVRSEHDLSRFFGCILTFSLVLTLGAIETFEIYTKILILVYFMLDSSIQHIILSS